MGLIKKIIKTIAGFFMGSIIGLFILPFFIILCFIVLLIIVALVATKLAGVW